jgi:hypothetical protein
MCLPLDDGDQTRTGMVVPGNREASRYTRVHPVFLFPGEGPTTPYARVLSTPNLWYCLSWIMDGDDFRREKGKPLI